MKLKENAFLWFLTGCGAIALAAAIDADREPRGFFVAVHVVVCFASTYAAVRAFRAKKEIWTWLLGGNAILYNPFVLVRLTREVWSLVDVVDIVLLVAAGIVLRIREDRPIQAGEPNGAAIPALGVSPKQRVYRSPSRTELAIWLTLLLLCLASVFMSRYYASVDGTSQSEVQTRNAGAATLGLAFWGYVIARVRRWRHPGRIAWGGFLAGLVTLFVASAAGVYTKGTEMTDSLASIARFDPALAARLKAGKSADGRPLSAMLGSSLSRAIEQAPDTAVVAFMEERFAIVQSNSPKALKWCVAAFNGSGDIQLNADEQLRMMQALGHLYSAAATGRTGNDTDADRTGAIASLTAVYKKIDPDGILGDEEKTKALSDQEKCDMYTRLMRELKALPPKEGAAAIRAMLNG